MCLCVYVLKTLKEFHTFTESKPVNQKWYPLLIIIVLGGLLFYLKNCRETAPKPSPKKDITQPKRDPAAGDPDRDKGFDRRTALLEYSKHATCRMDCRHISKSEVEEIMRDGKINYNKSDLQNARCPRYAVEGVTSDNQRVRIVYAQCNNATTVVTVIDLETDFECHCPGDDDKYKNRN